MGRCRVLATDRVSGSSRSGAWIAFVAILGALLLSACSAVPEARRELAGLSPLEYGDNTLSPADVGALAPTPDLLAMDDSMRAFVERYVQGGAAPRQRLESLHRAVTGSATLGVDYDPAADGSARDAFHGRSANCLSFASLFLALAREAELDASYQWVDVRPQWSRMGQQIAVSLHVNVLVKISPREQLMVDLDPLPPQAMVGKRTLRDRDVQALYHSNLAVKELAGEHLDRAWAHAVRALQLSPGLSHLWVNLGVVYRHAGQDAAAEQAYLTALRLDQGERSAMNNLVLLYTSQGREEERDYWEAREARYRQQNPFYHAWLGDRAGEQDDWAAARDHYQVALELMPEDAGLLSALGEIYMQLGQREAARRHLEAAVDRATVSGERAAYRARYRQLLGDDLVSTVNSAFR